MRLKEVWIVRGVECGLLRHLSVCSTNARWLSSQVMAAGGLEVTTQENLATEPSVTTTATGCTTNAEIPAKNDLPSVAVGCLKER